MQLRPISAMAPVSGGGYDPLKVMGGLVPSGRSFGLPQDFLTSQSQTAGSYYAGMSGSSYGGHGSKREPLKSKVNSGSNSQLKFQSQVRAYPLEPHAGASTVAMEADYTY